ncbi:hypothetical protein ZTR_07395 [Talaromyces verruculosus]|nr:hypothetical protein ZTR_07395 [Talaromyces verruculosus]
MRAVVFAGKLQVTLEKRPKPTIQVPTDVIVKVQYTALCGRVPVADATLVAAPTAIDPKMLVVMADIFPTGYFAASNALSSMNQEEIQNSTVVLLGCGPVGICALISALEFRPRHILAIDNIQSRLDLAESLGAEPWNFQTQSDALQARVKELTDGRGADVVIEVVGLKSALKLAFDILRPCGVISSVGVHNEDIPWTANQAYGKNLRIQMGRCPRFLNKR